MIVKWHVRDSPIKITWVCLDESEEHYYTGDWFDSLSEAIYNAAKLCAENEIEDEDELFQLYWNLSE